MAVGQRLGTVASAIAASLIPLRAQASQPPSSAPQAEEAQADENSGLQTVIVTAQRRPEQLQRVPVSVVSLSDRDLEDRSVTNLRALQYFVPNLTFAPSQNVGEAAGNIFIRGIGQEDFVAGAEAGVGFYVDGVYVVRTMGTLLNLLDIEQVEVLRGPQGTLYGKNTIGGAITLTSVKPHGQAEAQADLIAGNLGRAELRATANAPLTDTLFARISAGRFVRGGYLERIGAPVSASETVETNDDREGRERSRALRLQLRWTPSPSLTVDVAADASRRRGTQSPTHIDAIDASAGILPAVNALIRQGKLPGPEIVDTLATDDWLKSHAGGNNLISQDIEGIAATVAREAGPHTIKAIAAYRSLRSHVATDLDGTWLAIAQNDFREHHRQYSAELQAQASLGRFRYTAGLFALGERMNTSSGRGRSRADVLYLCGCYYAPARRPLLTLTQRGQTGDSLAAYAQAGLHFARRWKVTLGGRFSDEGKSTDVELVQLDPDTLEPTSTVLRTAANEGRWSSLTWRAALEFQANRDVMLYASAAKGYKSGGFNTRPVVNLPNLGVASFAPETALTYESGIRSEWFDRRLRVNASLFHTDYRNMQLRQTSFVDGVLTTLIENAAAARVRGIEIEAAARLGNRFTASVAYGHVDAHYHDVGTVPGLTLDTPFQRTPRHSFTASLDYSVALGERSLTLHGDCSYRSREQFQILPSPFDQPGYALLGARVTFRDPGRGWSVALFGTNLSDRRYRVAGRDGLESIGIANSVIGPPRQVGVEFKAGF